MGYTKKKINELKELCQTKGLSTEGNKTDLIKRLTNYDHNRTTGPMPTTIVEKTKTQPEIFPTTATVLTHPCLHIRANNLPNYLSFGHIYPLDLEESEIYKTENRENDVLSLFPQYILLSFGAFNSFDDQDVLIELVIDNLDCKSVYNNSIVAISQPIPISRIKCVYFKSEVERSRLLASIDAFQDSFLPESITKVFVGEPSSIKLNQSELHLPPNEKLNEWRTSLNRFDRLMGMFAFMKNVGLFYSTQNNQLAEFTRSYFAALFSINPIDELQSFRINTLVRPLLFYRKIDTSTELRVLYNTIINHIYSDRTFNIKDSVSILEAIANEGSNSDERPKLIELANLFKRLDNFTISFKELLSVENIRQNMPLLAMVFLTKFPNKGRSNSDKQAVRNVLLEEVYILPLNMAEAILAILGTYYGYKNMPRADTNLNLSDKYFQIVTNMVQCIKFKMESYLDRFIIESCFQFAITEQPLANSFSYLQWEGRPAIRPPINVNNSEIEYTLRQFPVLNYNVTTIVRLGKIDRLLEELKSIYPDGIAPSSYVMNFLLKYGVIDSSYLIEQIRRNPNRFPLDEFQDTLALDKKHKKVKR